MTRSEAGKLGAIKTNSLGINKRIHERLVEEYYKNPKRCCECGKIIPYENRKNKNFCSQRCNAIFTNKKHGHYSEHHEPIKCLVCGTIIEHPKAGRKFCSIQCNQTYKRIKRFEEVDKLGEFDGGKTGEASRPFVKSYLIFKIGRKCSICGITEWCGKEVPLVVDHIDGNAFNNKVDNFRLVCGNCDMQLSTYKNRNRGHGRKSRKQFNAGMAEGSKAPSL